MKKIFLSLAIVLCWVMSRAQTTNYQVHSLFVLNIAKYSTWPTEPSEFVVVIYGKSRMYDELTKVAAGKSVNGKPIRVRHTDDVSGIGDAHIVFLADGRSGSLDDILKATTGKPTLIIAEREGLYKKGAAFSFVVMDNNTLRYDVNHAELEKRGIRISRNLTSLANAVI